MIKRCLQSLLNGDGSVLDDPSLINEINMQVNQIIMMHSNCIQLSDDYIEMLGDIIHIGNIVYNNIPLDDDKLPIDNGTYDILLEVYRMYRQQQVGAEPINFSTLPKIFYESRKSEEVKPLVTILPEFKESELLFNDELLMNSNKSVELLKNPLVTFSGYESSKKYRIVSHGNPDLVGTLDKCKCVLINDVDEETLKDPSYKILERDFFGNNITKGRIDPNEFYDMVVELKYDGLSTVVTVKNGIVIRAISRGDTGMDKAVDQTPVLYGYRFPNLPNLDIEIDVKCEAVMTYEDLYYYNLEKGNNYVNCRSAIIGLLSSNDGYLYQKYITLVPLAVAATHEKDVDKITFLDRIDEITFINKYLATKEWLRYGIVSGDYKTSLFLIKRFMDEAEYVRPIMPTMYDGIVVSYSNKTIQRRLGRENFVNKYSMAVKFPTMKKMTHLTAITYTVGQNGVITPMAHYNPVEFLGTIHTKSSIASVERFNKNRFKIGNVIEVEYRNDVMPYVTTPLLDVNEDNPNEILQFITECPSCGKKLEFSKTMKSAKCINLNCPGRNVARISSMLAKLGIKDFAEAMVERLGVVSLDELMHLTTDDITPIIGPINASKLILQISSLKKDPIYDYQLFGAIGFTGLAMEIWKKIFNVFDITDIMNMYKERNFDKLLNIKGIGKSIVSCITEEFPFFEKDINLMISVGNLKSSKGLLDNQKSIRVSGFRDPELMDKLIKLGYDASDKSVTKSTSILLIPYEGYTSSKLKKVGENTLIISKDDFISNMDHYLSLI
ncbi:hypothetical protein [uncultured Clostridium sp.]|uniref:hypothetical protein n=1 Tax=uncultured Clostridium sp. TaxID=59620 RepID=UPI00263ADAE6|nr:hypothetical protein [uncultured Clostridium sp.]